MWRGMLGNFDVAILDQPASLMMFVFFQFIVVVLMMNLIIAIMGGSDQHHIASRFNHTTHARNLNLNLYQRYLSSVIIH